jgi:2-aminoadipate transaminase
LRRAAQTRGTISFAGGLPDPARFPKAALSRAFVAALAQHADVALQYGWPEGDQRLRRAISKLLRARGARVSAERVIVTSGAQQALTIAALAAPRHRKIAVDKESYPAALEAFRALGGQLVDSEAAADVEYVMPSVSNPRGERMSPQQRKAVLSRAAGQRYVIEDDAYDGTSFVPGVSRPLLASAPDRVFHVGTFSKTLSPGLRIGWLVAPPGLHDRALKQKQQQDLQASGLSQALLVEYLRSGGYAEHQRRSAAAYRRQLVRLERAVRRALPEFRFRTPGGGFSLWLESDLRLDELAVLEAAVRARVSFDPGSAFLAKPSSKLAMRLCFSAVPADKIEAGVARLAQAIARVRARER